MSWLYALLTKRDEGAQRGALSPFMFGLIVGMSIFSVLSSHYAHKELLALQERQAQRAQAQAEDVVKALEFAAMTETHSTYDDTFTYERAQGNLARATGQTRGGQEFVVNTQDTNDETFGVRNQRVAITASDDTLLRAQVYQAGDADRLRELAENDNRPVAVFDSGAVRERQVLTSDKAMRALAEQIYAFYAGNMRFPRGDEFDELQSKFPYRDAWGGEFAYQRTDSENARLEFTTPWGYTQPLIMSLGDE